MAENTNIKKGFQGVRYQTGTSKNGYTWYAIDLCFVSKNGKSCYRRVWLTPRDVRALALTEKFGK